jgi:D-beta-D-heptose 7-phosphate kinase/D-beta-D-heptose 1-phosphate adenosyltransferase
LIEQLNRVIDEIEHEWQHKQLLVVGDVMLDKYIWGEVERISPEAPVPVVRATHESAQPGGAANVAMNLARLSAKVIVAGFTGHDENAKLLEKRLADNGISPLLTASEEFPTTTKLRVIGGHQQMLRLDSERQDARKQEDYDRLAESVIAHLAGCHAVVLSDYAKGALTPQICERVIEAARREKVPVVVDPKSADFTPYRGATTICPNLGELTSAVHFLTPEADRRDLRTLLESAQTMVTRFDLEFLAATLGEKGIALIRPGSFSIMPAVARQVFDVSGAGDTVAAVLALCLASGLKPEISVQLSNMAAGIVVGKVGTVPVEKHELLAALMPEIAAFGENKVVNRNELLTRVATWKANGERVVFTNGCFDLLHVGHITLLEQARSFGDRLIVGINSDASVRKLKGPSRPIVGERERGRVLAALAAVDAVVVFDESTPLELIVATRPDVLVKGGDYSVSTVVGAAEVQASGGQVKIVPTVENFSTTSLIEKTAQQ